MLEVAGLAGLTSERVEMNGYFFAVRWKMFPSLGLIYWRAGDYERSILEIGMERESKIMKSLELTIVGADRISATEIVDFSSPDSIRQQGLPIFQWSPERFDAWIINERIAFSIYIGPHYLSLRIHEERKIKSIIRAERVAFGVDEADKLCAIQVTELSTQEIAALKSYYPSQKERPRDAASGRNFPCESLRLRAFASNLFALSFTNCYI